ncbi:MAG: xylose isomerase [Chloroflexi bacterium]|nr:xylose isomerase [Chloroflexota bacterium]
MSTQPLKQSFAWWCIRAQVDDPAAFLRQARQIGYEGVELLPRELWDSAREAGLLIATEVVGKIERGLNRQAHHAELEEEIGRKLELAAAYGIPNLIVFSGNRAGLSDAAGIAATVEGLQRLAPAAEAKGVTLILELLNSKIDHLDYQCDHTAWGVQVVEQVNSPQVKLLYDIYHMQVMEGDVIRTLRQAAPHIGHIHTAGNPGRHDLDADQELNYPAIMRAIQGIGYGGYIGQEFRPKGDPLEALRLAYRLCDV